MSDMRIGPTKPPEMPFEPNVGKAASQPLKAQLPAKASGPVTISSAQEEAIAKLPPSKFDSNMAILSQFKGSPVNVSTIVANDIDETFHRG